MKALLIYFSGTGNTEMITTAVISGLKAGGWDAEAVSVESLNDKSRDFNFNLRTMDLIGFGFPVYKFSYPDIMSKIFPFLSNLKPSGKPFFVFSTYCRFPSTALHRMAGAVERAETADADRPHVPIAMQAFKCPSNGIASLKQTDSRDYREVMYFSPGIGQLVEQFTKEITANFERFHNDGRGVAHRGSPIDGFREGIVEKIEHSRYPSMSIDVDKCTVCGLCVKQCPDGNLVSSSDERTVRRIIIKDDENCLHCLRCLHICPYKAITFGPLVHGPSRYRPAVRKKLYAEAEAKAAGAKEPGSAAARLRWALVNLWGYLWRQR